LETVRFRPGANRAGAFLFTTDLNPPTRFIVAITETTEMQ
jgi:hypothetical protein